MGQYSQQVNLEIVHDWSKTKTAMENLLRLKDRVPCTQYGDADHYELNALGTISDHRPSKGWYRISGPAITATMPWLPGFLDSMRDLGPDDGCISYLDGDGAGHIDLPHLRTALNYVFDNQDPDAYTWIDDSGHREVYPSHAGSAWLLNTQISHGIKNSGKRWTLSIHFNSDYDQVKKWFDERPFLQIGRQQSGGKE